MNSLKRMLSHHISRILIAIFMFQAVSFLPSSHLSIGSAAILSENDIELIRHGLRYNRRDKINYHDVAVKNISENNLEMPIRVVIGEMTDDRVSVANPDGTTEDGFSYFEFGESGQVLDSGETSDLKEWQYSNPDRVRFNYSIIRITDNSSENKVRLTASASSTNPGGPITLTWTSPGADTAYIEPDIGLVELSGSVTVSPVHTTMYTLTAKGSSGVSTASVVVKVLGASKIQPEGSFGHYYQDLIPEDATIESYDTKRFALITGSVTAIDETPLAGVSVTILNHPEYGTAVSGEDGGFVIPVEGGASFVTSYIKEGYIPIQRKTYVPWNDYAVIDPARMIVEDTAATRITLDGNSGSVFIHRSSPVTDESGTRKATVVIKGDNQAFLTDKDGNNVMPLETFNLRVTEYPTPESMPAVLPPTSAFTYCAEFSVDGAKRVKFADPVTVYVDNFLGFDVGGLVPVGYYGRDTGIWVPSDNGRVVKLMDINSDGVVDALDMDGDDIADDIDGDGSVEDEILGLTDSENYSPGDTFWRFETDHFSPWDPNHAPFLPDWAVAPRTGPPIVDMGKSNNEDAVSCINSYVEDRNRVFHEDILVPGTDFTLHYSSDNLVGNRRDIYIPLTGDSLPTGLLRVDLLISVGGKSYKYEFAPSEKLGYWFNYDGKDFRGRKIYSPVSFKVAVSYLYQGYYGRSYDGFVNWFAKYPQEDTRVLMRARVFKTSFYQIWIRPFSYDPGVATPMAEGWTISNHHYLSPIDTAVLKKGNGSKVSSFDSDYKYKRIDTATIMEPVVANSVSDSGEEESDSDFATPQGMAMDAQGNIYIADTGNQQIKKIDTWGNVILIAGNGNKEPGFPASSSERVVATDVPLFSPQDLCVDSSGNIYFIDLDVELYVCVVRKIDTKGILSNVIKLYLDPPWFKSIGRGIAVDDNGNIYIADSEEHFIWMVDPAGNLDPIAGIGGAGYSGDDGRSMDAELNEPHGIAIDKKGFVYIADSGNHAIRRINPDGTIRTIAGTGEQGYSGDGGPATSAKLNYPTRIDLDNEGNVYFIDNYNNCLRKINTKGIIQTLAGQGTIPYGGQNLPFEPELLTSYSDLNLNDNGDVFVLFSSPGTVTRLGPITPYLYSETAGNNVYTEENGLGYAIDNAGRHLKTIDLETGVVLKTFNYTGTTTQKLNSIVDQFGNTTTIERGIGQIPSAIVSPDGLRTELTIDENSHLTRISLPDGNYYAFNYSTDGLMEVETDPKGNRFTHIFTESGKLAQVQDETGGKWTFDRAIAEDRVLTTVTTAEGNQRSYLDTTDDAGIYTSVIADETGSQTLFTESGMTASKTTACGMDLAFEYGVDSKFKYKYLEKLTESTPSGLQRTTTTKRTYTEPTNTSPIYTITQEVATNGKTTTVENNVFESRKTMTSPEGRTITTLYDSDTLVPETVRVPGLLDINFEYNDQGRLISATTGTRTTSYQYNDSGFLKTLVDPQNNETSFVHDTLGRTTQVLKPDNTTMYFDYDAAGNMTVLTTPRPADHTFEYNKVNLKAGYTTPLSGSYSFGFDRDRRPTTTIFPSGRQIVNTYENGSLTRTQTPEGNIDFSYYCGSKIRSMTKGGETLAWEYDGKLVTALTQTGRLSQPLGFTYNTDFRPVEFTYAGATQDYEYDQDGLLTGAGDFTITRNPANGLPESVSNGTLSLTRIFNGYGEPSTRSMALRGQSLVSQTLERNDNARIVTKTETVNGTTIDYAYTYDARGRLLTVTRDNVLVEEYQYDQSGSRSYEMNSSRGITGRNFTYSDEDHLLTAGGVDYAYDVDGFLATRTQGQEVTSYTYSSRGELLSVSLPDGNLIEYLHDPLGRRIAKKVNGAVTEKYLWNGLTQLLAVYDGSDGLLMRFEYADGRMPLSVVKEGIRYYLGYNQVGSLILVATAAGNPVRIMDYDAFGNITGDSNPDFSMPFGFAGGLYDADTGLVRFGYRDYDPETGRWTAKDPIGFAGGDTDLFGYVLNDPVNFIDPLGLQGDAGHLNWMSSAMSATNKSGPTQATPIKAGITLSAGTFDFDSGLNKKGHSSALLGASIDLTIGDPGVAEVGMGMKNLGLGANLDNGGVVGVTGHFGLSFPPSFGYGSVSTSPDQPCPKK